MQELLPAQQFSIPYYYLAPEDYNKVELFCTVSGDTETGLINQYVRGWISRNRPYYLELSKLDAQKRQLTSEQWVDIMLDEGVKGLPQYKHDIGNGEIQPNPLAHVVMPGGEKIRRNINYIVLAAQNIALLRIAIFYDRDSIAGYISRVVKEHLDRNWEKLYIPQIEAAKSKDWF